MKLLEQFIEDNRTISIDKVDTKLCKEIQEILVDLDLLDKADGIIGVNTIRAFKRFKEINYQSSPEILGVGSAKLLLSAADKNSTPVNEVQDEVIAPDAGYTVGKINWLDFNCPISKYFTVREVVNSDHRRVPTTQENIKKILFMAKELDKIRIAIGKPILVNSWNRPPKINADVGGARYSQHIQGWGVDIRCQSMSIFELQKWLDAYWYGALGYGAKKGFVHIDPRNNKGFKSGGNKGVRWPY
jgi:putative chitinase